MFVLVFLVSLTTFGEFFTGAYTSIVGRTSKYTVTSSSCFVSQSRFSLLSDKAIVCSNSGTKLVIGDSFFYQVSSSTHGGAVFFDCSNGECAIKGVCSYGCVTTSSNSFGSFIHASQHLKCVIYDASIIKSSVENPQHEQSAVLCFFGGINHIKNSNLSHAQLRTYVVGLIVSTTECSFNFSTISHNFATFAAIFEMQYINTMMYRDNFVNNTVSDISTPVFSQYGGGVMSFIQSILINCATNNDQSILSNTDFFFSQCYVNKGYIPPEIRTGIIFSSTSTYQFTHYATHLCLTPHSFTPTKKPESIPYRQIPKLTNIGILAIFLV